MRHIKNILAGTFALATVALVAGCIKEDYIGTCEQPEAGDITIVASLDKMKLTKATVEDNATERTITHIDIFVVDSEGNIDWYERNADGNDKTQGQGSGYLKLSQKRTTKVNGNYLFEQGEEYKIYLLANSAQTEATMKSLLTKDALEALVEQTEKVYCTGMEEAPQTFLMDAVAKLGNSASIEINPVTTPTEHLELKATFNRAASKVIVNIKQGTEVSFVPEGINSVLPQAEFNNLATKTSVLPLASPLADAGLVNSEAKNVDNKVLAWDADTKTYTVTAYTYSHLWEEGADNESALIVNIPMLWDEDGKDEAGKLEIDDQAPESWYKIPLSQDNEFGRNFCYIVNLTINAVGAPSELDIIEFQDVEFVSLPWQEVEMEIGQNEPKYLVLNTDLVEIYDVNEDLEQLKFTSSSPIKSITLKDCYNHDDRGNIEANAEMAEKDGLFVYYIDKFGQKIQLGQDPGFDLKDVDHPAWTKADILAKEMNLYNKAEAAKQHIRAEVPQGQERALNGDIHIFSPINAVAGNEDLEWDSHFNTVRYLEFEVENIQGLTAVFRVEQIPLAVITNEEGFYSYRDDHVLTDDPNETPTHYLNYRSDFRSFMTSAMHLIHPHDFTDEPKTEEWINTPQADRNYKTWWKKPEGSYPWLNNSTNECPVQGTGDLMWVEVRYGFYNNYVTWNNGKNSGNFSGIYRTADGQRPYPDNHYFFRERFAGTGITKTDTQGSPFGPYYELEVEVNGEKQTRILRDHYLWQAMPIFWSKFRGKYYDKPSNSEYYSGVSRVAGQVDIHEYGPADSDDSKKWGKYSYSNNLKKYANHRMYNIKLKTTSLEYIAAFPRLDSDGHIINDENNSILVSPNISVASQLGETCHQQFREYIAKNQPNYIMPNIKDWYYIAERQCNNYVETTFVDKNGNHEWDEGEEIIEYHDWRLPTLAEISSIIKFQTSSRAMDKVLSARYYFCITGNAESDDLNNIHNWVSPELDGYLNDGYYVRCVRDVNRTK